MIDIVERLRAEATDNRRYEVSGTLATEAADRIAQLEADQRDTTEEFGRLSHDLGNALLEVERLREANELMLTDIRRTDVDMLAFKARIEQLEAALTPSAETKAAYMGEFRIPFPTVDEDGNEGTLYPNVPWTTIKEIMAAIRARAALGEKE